MSAATKSLRLPPMPKISDIIRLYGLRAQKQLSQNFILDLNVTDKMAAKADVFDCHVVEVGSGPGSLTRSLLTHGVRHLHAVEIDKRFLPSLQILQDASQGHMTVHHGDIMRFDFSSVLRSVQPSDWPSEALPNMRLVGNLPFSVSIPLLLQWLQALRERKGPFACGRVPMSLVFQKEVAENLVAPVNSVDRSRLTIMTQYCCDVHRAIKLKSTVFTPEPQVDACLVNFIPRQKPLIDAPHDLVEQVVKAVFTKRRKVVRTSLRSLFPGREELADELLHSIRLDPKMRAHNLEVEHFGLILHEFLAMCKLYDLNSRPLPVNTPQPVADESET